MTATPQESLGQDGAAAVAPPVSRDARPWKIAAGLVLLVALVFGQVCGFGFVNLDDQQYVYDHPLVLRGLRLDGAVEALSAVRAGNWHPLTLLSHMADVSLFGLDAGWHHAVSVVLHATNAVLLFLFLRRGTGATWRSGVVAALFAIHPLHVESVAWISERKDVLSTLFFLLALHAYLAHVRRPRAGTWAALLCFHALGLLSKPMVVTLPFVLLLLDLWPLGRWPRAAANARRAGAALRDSWPLVREKLPLLALSAAASAVAWYAQQAGGAVAALEEIPPGGRVANAIIAYATYLRQAAWPSGLASFYPHPAVVGGALPVVRVAAAALLLAAVTVLVLRERTRRPYLAVGWLWYLGMLVPVIGIVQVGMQAHADRYTYVPLVGVFVAAVWLAADVAKRLQVASAACAIAAAAALLPLAWAARVQAATWRDSETLHRRALAVTERNSTAWIGLGDALAEGGKAAEALRAYEEALRIRPDLGAAWSGIGAAHGRLGRHDLAIAALERALQLNPRHPEAWYNLGTAHGNLGRHAEAMRCFREAVRHDPRSARAWANLGVASVLLGDARTAAESHERLLALDPPRAAALLAQMRAAGL